MKKVLLPLLFCFSMVASANDIASNKKLVTDFYTQVILYGKYDAIDNYIGDKYIQHNPMIADGKEALREMVKSYAPAGGLPKPGGEIIRVIAEDNLVVLHVKNYNWPSSAGGAIVDIFRVEDGLIVEHWDVIQEIPKESANSNGMF